jgi:hypothetical protein
MESCERCGDPLVPGEPCALCLAMDELSAERGLDAAIVEQMDAESRLEFAELRVRDAAVSDTDRAAQQAEFERRLWELPAGVPPLGSELEFDCAFLDDGETYTYLKLKIGDDGVFCWDPASQICTFRHPWTHVALLDAEGPESVDRRVSIGRILGLGVLGLAAKKSAPKSFVVIETVAGERNYFEVASGVFELRAHLARRSGWLAQNSAVLRARRSSLNCSIAPSAAAATTRAGLAIAKLPMGSWFPLHPARVPFAQSSTLVRAPERCRSHGEATPSSKPEAA